MATNRTKRQAASRTNIFRHMEALIAQKRKAGKESTADLYRATCNRLKKHHGSRPLPLSEITPAFVDGFIGCLQADGTLKVNTVNSYVSAFRAMYNVITRESGYLPSPHPFAHVTIYPGRTLKRSVRTEAFERISSMDFGGDPALQLAADLCTFSFVACGIPFADLVCLTHKNIEGDVLVYHRRKTGSLIRVGITEGMRALLDKYAASGTPYLFPLHPANGDLPHEGYKRLLRRYNSCLKKIGKKIGLETALTSYVVRHSWATAAYRKYVPVAVIGQALGHSSEKTTRHYIGQLDMSELCKANRLVTENVDRIVREREVTLN